MNIDNSLLAKKITLHDALCVTPNNIPSETEETINTIVEMYNETQSDKPFKWVYKFNQEDGHHIDINVEFYPKKGLVLSLLNLDANNNNQLVEYQAAKEYLEEQTRNAIHMAEDLAIAQQEAAKSAQQIQTILNAMDEGLVTMNEHCKFISVNNAMSVIFGYTPSEFEQIELHELIISKDIKTTPDVKRMLDRHVVGFNIYKCDYQGIRKNGSQVPLKIDIREVYLGSEKHYTLLFRDVTEQYNAEKTIRRMAMHDSLTGLANRNLLSERLNDALKMAKRLNKKVSVMLLDLDNFKPVNDLYGHEMGDKLLKVVSERLLECAREVDTVARLGGDEFAIIFTNIENDQNIITIADRVINSIQQPTIINGQTIQIGTSIGISFFPQNSDNPAELIRMADVALYQAKDDGRRVFRLYDQQMDDDTKAQKQIEIDLNKAIENDELLLYYQPQIDARNNRMVAAEALIRWNHPIKGLIPPYSFISTAELTGLMIPIGRWVLNTACLTAKKWQDQGFSIFRMCVNISARQFHSDNFVETIEYALSSSKLEACWLELEITEGMVVKDTDIVIKKLERISSLGINLSIDDFGTGYSSLAYLKKFPVKLLKIDQSFVRDIHEDQDDAAITDAVIRLGHSLGLTVVAEGVETEEHVKILKEKGCDILQGYYFSRPIAEDEFTKYIENLAENKS